jgi:hypothetical protein
MPDKRTFALAEEVCRRPPLAPRHSITCNGTMGGAPAHNGFSKISRAILPTQMSEKCNVWFPEVPHMHIALVS